MWVATMSTVLARKSSMLLSSKSLLSSPMSQSILTWSVDIAILPKAVSEASLRGAASEDHLTPL